MNIRLRQLTIIAAAWPVKRFLFFTEDSIGRFNPPLAGLINQAPTTLHSLLFTIYYLLFTASIHRFISSVYLQSIVSFFTNPYIFISEANSYGYECAFIREGEK